MLRDLGKQQAQETEDACSQQNSLNEKIKTICVLLTQFKKF